MRRYWFTANKNAMLNLNRNYGVPLVFVIDFEYTPCKRCIKVGLSFSKKNALFASIKAL